MLNLVMTKNSIYVDRCQAATAWLIFNENCTKRCVQVSNDFVRWYFFIKWILEKEANEYVQRKRHKEKYVKGDEE